MTKIETIIFVITCLDNYLVMVVGLFGDYGCWGVGMSLLSAVNMYFLYKAYKQ